MLPFLLSLLVAGASAGSYLISAPNSIQRGSSYDISVDILNTTGVLVEASLQDRVYNGNTNRYDIVTLQSVNDTFGQGQTGTLSLDISETLQCSNCQLHIRGSGGLQFERNLASYISGDVVATLVQTDKALYKPGQIVRFRAFAVYPDLQLYTGEFNVEIRDPNDNKIKVLNNLSSASGVVEDILELSEQPLYGTWKITIILEDLNDIYTQTFEVADYELPRFEITVDLPPYGLVSDSLLTGKVKAEYTFGQQVQGRVELHVGPNQGPNSCGDLPKTTQITFDIDGEASFSIPKDDIERAVRLYDNQDVKVTAYVTESATGVRLNGSSVITYYSREHDIEFTDNTPNVFKPGLPYTAFIRVSTPDNMPPQGDNNTVSVYTYVSYELTVDDQSLYGIAQFSGTYPLPGKNVTLPANGLLPFDIDIPSNATSITVRATFKGRSTSKTVEKMYSKSNNFVQLSLLDKNVKAGSTVTLKLDGTEELGDVSYQVLSRGVIVETGTLNGGNQKSFTFDLTVTPDMAPTAHLLAYYPRGNDEVVADSLAFNVEGIFHNNVSISFSKNESQPAENVDVIVMAEPGSSTFIAAVDQSVLLLRDNNNDITPEKVNDAVSPFDKGSKPSDDEFALSYSAETVEQVFSQTGLTVITDVDLSKPSRFVHRMDYEYAGYNSAAFPLRSPPAGPPAFGFGGGATADAAFAKVDSTRAPEAARLQQVERIRNIFPETWLWAQCNCSDGKATISTTVPDTITSWVASAWATHPTSGLGVAPTTAKLQVFRPFFVSLTYPSSVIRGEQLVIQAVVFNYLPQAQVTVTLKGSTKFQSVQTGSNGQPRNGDVVLQVDIATDDQGVVYFPIEPTEIGVLDIEITAQSTQAADGVRRQIIVEPEGAPVQFNYPIFVNINATNDYNDNIAFPLPDSLVQGSDKAKVKVTGDLIGSSLDSLEVLLQLPTGCGEQSMVKFSPDLYIAKYLKTTGQLTDALSRKIIRLLEAGYQRQLTYQRSDGGFSAFGNLDESGSTWLTAYVSRDLSVAREFIYVDPDLLIRAVDWLVSRQNIDGSFNEFGKVLDRNIQGSGTGAALTAFVLLSLLQNRDLAPLQPCLDNKINCNRVYRWGNATQDAISNLERLVTSDAINEQFPLSVVAYALTVARSKQADVAFNKLFTFANLDGNLVYWSDNATVINRPVPVFRSWRPPREQARPIDILITSYALLTYTETSRLDEAFPVLQWLTTQRNSFGGFASTQDTAVGLQALSAYAAESIRPDTNIHIQVTNQGPLAEFDITKQNALVLQIQELDRAPNQANVKATGTGFALVEIDLRINVDEELTTPSFDVSTVLLDDDLDSFNLMICTKYLFDRNTGMVVQQVSIPSGFQPDLSSLNNVAGLKRSERRGDTVDIYFDQITRSSICYSIMMTRTGKVAKNQPGYIRTVDYYEPNDQSTVFWQPRKLRDSTICDVCDGCCP